MKRRLVVAAALLAGTLAMPAAVSADYLSTCPDQMFLIPAELVPEGDKKDHNNNGIICGKFEDSGIKGGPDEDFRDDIPV